MRTAPFIGGGKKKETIMILRILSSTVFLSGTVLLLAGCASQPEFTQSDALLIHSLRNAGQKEYEAALSTGANVNARNAEGMTPILMAAIADKPFYIRDLIKRGADVNAADLKGNTPLHVAAGKRYPDTLITLLEYPVNLEAHGSFGRTPLMEAARLGNVKAMELLIGKGADVNARDEMERTPLMHAARANQNSREAVSLLLKKGADPELFDQDSMSAVMHAAALKHTDAALLLLDLYPNFVNNPAHGLIIMYHAVKGGDLKVASALVDKQVPLNWDLSIALRETRRIQVHGAYRILARNGVFSLRRTPLIWAAIENNLEMVKLLVERGANPGQEDENGDSPYDLATDQNVVRYLKNATKEYYEKLREEKNK